MTKTKYVIGIDGGGTSTVARIADQNGNVLSMAEAGPSNLQTVGPDECVEIFDQVVTEVCGNSNVSLGDVPVVVYGTAGAGRKADQETLHAAIVRRWNNIPKRPEKIKIVSDADVALEAAFGGDPGIIIIAGTGSIVYGRDADGTIHRSGGWGPLLGDPGSGTSLGLKALRAAAKTFDGCIELSALLMRLNKEYGITSSETLIEKVYKEKFPPSQLAPLVVKTAEGGDEVALQILEETADELVEMLMCCIKKFNFKDEIPLAYIGGLLQSETVYPKLVTKKINVLLPNIVLKTPRFKPEEGAVAMALRLLED